MADGVRGRRWRSILVDGNDVVGVVLLESAPDGAPVKLEVASAAGLLTLHPDGSTLHGNVVRPTGMEHVAVPWRDGSLLLAVGTPTTAAAAARTLAERVGIGQGHTVPGVSVDAQLHVRAVTYRVARVGPRGWWFVTADTGQQTGVTLDLDGIPLLAEAVDWPLELEPPA
ncbi:MAG TPA: hypothetical protein VFQ75_00625 [Candidatus Limnocylindrales bacterium]|nr:hypothetical protein [Candidatus Limnocylindrales bacterium]